MSMHTVTTRKLSERDGSPRLWLEGKRLLNSGFEPGHQFVVEPYGLGVVLKLQVQGTNKVARRERKKTVALIPSSMSETPPPWLR